MPKWTLTTEFTFDSAHYIEDYNGPCGRLHGHTYRVQIEAMATQLHSSVLKWRSSMTPHRQD